MTLFSIGKGKRRSIQKVGWQQTRAEEDRETFKERKRVAKERSHYCKERGMGLME